MSGDFSRNTLAPLVLRVGLAALLIYSGYDKVYGRAGTEWGTRWANLMFKESQIRLSRPETKNPVPDLEEQEKSKKTKEAAKEKAPPPKEVKTSERPPASAYAEFYEQQIPDILQVPAVQAAVAWGELACGIGLALGLLTRLAALGIIIIQAGAIYLVTFARGYGPGGFGLVGFDNNILIVVGCLTLLFLGGGEFSMNRYLFGRKPRPKV